MSGGKKHSNLMRARHGHARVTNIELFFDLVFVYAVTQLSHALLHDLSPMGGLRTLLLFLGVWWVWIYTSWVTNWLDPDHTSVRLVLLALTLIGLVFSTSLPDAFTSKGMIFAGAYVTMQIGRSLFMLWALRGYNPANYRNFLRVICWLILSSIFWIWGGTQAGDMRLLLWATALAIEYVSPAILFYVPGLGRSSTSDWNVEGGHLAERCSLFIIIALGESLLVAGASFGEGAWNEERLIGFAVAFLGAVAMWWIYFDTGAERGAKLIASADDPGQIARISYTYLHLLIVAGIIVAAVGNALLLANPHDIAGTGALAVLLGGPALYLLGNGLFKRVIVGHFPLSHIGGLAMLAITLYFARPHNTLEIGAAAALILVIVAAWEMRSLRHYRAGLRREQ